MKIHVENAPLPEAEVTIRGDVTSSEVMGLLQLLKKPTSGKLLLCREEEQFLLDAGEVVFAEVSDSRVLVHTRLETFETRQKLYELMETLGPTFVQVNKSAVVNMNAVKSIQAEFSGNYRIRLKDRKERLTLSRKYFKDFKNHI